MDVKKLNMKASLLVNEALSRGYPVNVISETYSIYTIGINGKSLHFRTTDCGICPSFAYKICKSKIFTNLFLSHYNLNIPFYKFYSLGDEIDLSDLSFPLVVKPHDGSCNRGVTIDIQNSIDFKVALEYAYKYSDKVIVQKYVEGDLYRVFALGDQVVALTRLDPPSIVGDGISTITQLISNENQASYRGKDKLFPAKPIIIEDQLHASLDGLGYTLDSVLPVGKKIFLRKNPQMSFGGISTNIAFPSDLFGDCIKAAALLGLPWAGIDIISKDDSFSDYSIIEVNSQPDFKMHMYPSYGEPINIASMLMDLIEMYYS